MAESLLLNFSFLIFPVLIFLIFLSNKQRPSNKYILLLLSSISMVLCMKFPVTLNIGFIVDLRYIPFVIVALYGGYKYTFVLYILLNVYRFYIGGEGTLPSLYFSTTIFILAPLLNKKFIQLSSHYRVLWAVSASFLTMVLYLSTLCAFFQPSNQEFWLVSAYTITTYTLIMMIIVMLIEKIIANMKTHERFLHQERLSVISELSASVSHEIRNPLTVTNGFLQLLSESKNLTEIERQYVDYSLQELNRAEKIVSDYLALAKPQSENMVYSNLKDETEYVKNIMVPYANMHKVNIEFHFDNTLKTRYDKNQIQQCLVNLYKNGIEAMKDTGGTLSITISEKKNEIMIKVSDTGVGMTKEEVSRLGRPFYSTKTEGTGLGMLMVYSTINKVKGKIHVESKKGKGTTFLITIPV